MAVRTIDLKALYTDVIPKKEKAMKKYGKPKPKPRPKPRPKKY